MVSTRANRAVKKAVSLERSVQPRTIKDMRRGVVAIIASKVNKERTGNHRLDYGVSKKWFDEYKIHHKWLTMAQVRYALRRYSTSHDVNIDLSTNNNNRLTNDKPSDDERDIVVVSTDITIKVTS